MKKIKENSIFSDIFKYFVLILCLFVSAINFNLLMKPVSFVTGGTPGLSIIIEYFFDIPTNYVIYVVYIIAFVLSFIILGKKSIIGVLVATISYPLFISFTSNIIKYIIIDYNDFFLLCLFSGVINGICNGFIYKLGFASSGLGVLGPICNKCFHLPVAKVNFLVNSIIVLIGGFSFGIEMVLYAIIFLYLNKIISNQIIVGISSSKAVLIRSNEIHRINDYLYNNYGIEAVNLKVKGGFTNEDGIMSLIVIPTVKYNMIMNSIKELDNKLFYNVLDGYELSSVLQ